MIGCLTTCEQVPQQVGKTKVGAPWRLLMHAVGKRALQETTATRSAHAARIVEADANSQAMIVIASPDLMMLDLLQPALAREFFRVVVAQDAEQTVAVIDQQPDLIVLDQRMQHMEGFSLYRQIQSIRPLPTFLLATRALTDELVAALDCGIDDYLAAPFTPRELIARVRTILRRTATRNR